MLRKELEQPDQLQLEDLELQVQHQNRTIGLLQQQNQLQQTKLIELVNRVDQMITSSLPPLAKKSYVLDIDERIGDFVKQQAELEAQYQKSLLRGEELAAELSRAQESEKRLQKENAELKSLLNEYCPEKQKKVENKMLSFQLQNKILTEELTQSRKRVADLEKQNTELLLKVPQSDDLQALVQEALVQDLRLEIESLKSQLQQQAAPAVPLKKEEEENQETEKQAAFGFADATDEENLLLQ